MSQIVFKKKRKKKESSFKKKNQVSAGSAKIIFDAL